LGKGFHRKYRRPLAKDRADRKPEDMAEQVKEEIFAEVIKMYADVKVATYKGRIDGLFRERPGFERTAMPSGVIAYTHGLFENGHEVNLTVSQVGTSEIILSAVGDDKTYVSREFQKLLEELGLEPRDMPEDSRRQVLTVLYGES